MAQYVLVLFCINQHTTFEVHSFINSKDMIRAKFKNGSRDLVHAHFKGDLSCACWDLT